jgi:DNA replication ATP-dependent helicase Dna2
MPSEPTLLENLRTELEIIAAAPVDSNDRFIALSQFFNKAIRVLSKEELMVFKNFYAKFRYVLRSAPLTDAERENFDALRRSIRLGNKTGAWDERAIKQALSLLTLLLSALEGNKIIPKGYKQHYFTAKYPRLSLSAHKTMRVLCKSISSLYEGEGVEEPYFILQAYDLEYLEGEIEIYIKRHQFSDFTYLRNILLENAVLLLHHVAGTETPSRYSTRHDTLIVLEPDFLIDASAIGECFSSEGSNANIFFLSKLVANLPGPTALKGTIVGHYLDEMIRQPTLDAGEIFHTAQKNNALRAAQLGTAEMVSIRKSIRDDHLPNIVTLIKKESSKELWIEPTYFSSAYGLQGRLDLLAIDHTLDAKDIIELKSGSPTNPELGAPWVNHLMQVVSYDLLLNSTYGEDRRGFNAIFYSKCQVAPYRQVVSEYRERAQALRIRNYLVSRIYRLAGRDFEILHEIKDRGVACIPKFSVTELARFQQLYDPARIASQYYQEMLAFTLREMINAKVGDFLSEDNEEINGFATLWLNDLQHKENVFRVIYDLKFAGVDEELGHIRLSIPNRTPHAFRKGDLVILYPSTEQGYNCMRQHILKGSIKELSLTSLTVSINNKQTNYSFIRRHTDWIIEPDLYERNYWSIFSCLINVIGCSDRKKKILFGHEQPSFDGHTLEHPDSLTATQRRTIQDAVNARDYYLLQGPPGTGKTSTFLVNYVRQSLCIKQDKIVILAFTNSAVEKICESFRAPQYGVPVNYIRLGSRYVSDEFLFNQQLSDDNPDNWRRIVDSHQVFVSTVATFQNNLLLLKKFIAFKHIVIDEASQLTEAQLSGIIAAFDKFVLIGDHKQLPAVVTQEDKLCVLPPGSYLDRVNISDLRISLFERLFRNAKDKGWHAGYGQLIDHYRMHEQIASLITKDYDKELIAHAARQLTNKAPYILSQDHPFYGISQSRIVFIESLQDSGLKRNAQEARMVVTLVKMLVEDGKFKLKDIGIITPFRAQIVEIKRDMPQAWLEDEEFTIDTVERFQGGQRKIVIFSTTISNPRQLSSIQSIASNDADRTDRKMLVSISRAQEQIIVLGNQEALEVSPGYNRLMKRCKENSGYFDRSFSETILS